jgi:hypothetical protein
MRSVWLMYLIFYLLGSFFGVQRVLGLFKSRTS